MAISKYSPEVLRDGVDEILERKFPLDGYISQEIDKAIGVSIQEKIDEGFKWGMIIFPVFVPFFLSESEDIEKARRQFIGDNGGEAMIEFYSIDRPGEVIVLMK